MSWSIISSAPGTMPAAMMSLTVWLASATLSNTPSMVRYACGARNSRTSTRVTMPNMPSQPITAPRKS